MDINIDLGSSCTMDPDMVLGSIIDLDVIMALVGIAGHPGQHGLSGSMSLRF